MTTAPDLPADLLAWGARARAAALGMAAAGAERRTAALHALAAAVRARADAVLTANAQDVATARAAGLAPSLVDRLALDPARVEGMARAVEAVAAQPDPVGAEIARWTRPNGLDIARVRTPIGVLAVIYESRPNVGIDAAALAIRSGNALLLRGGSEAVRSALALQGAVDDALAHAGLPPAAVQTAPSADRAVVGALLSGLEGAVDLLIPRGGRGLVARVRAEARVPVLGHLEGRNATFLHASADLEMAVAVVVDAKMRRTSVCGATETLLVDRAGAARLLPPVADALRATGCELRGDPAACALAPPMTAASPQDWDAEHLDAILNVAVVDGVAGACAHIARHGSGHTDAIVAQDEAAVAAFTAGVDSAIVLHNASTQFADGGEFGFGAEIGIATDKLHARGPVGAEQLTTFKYVVRGSGQVRG